MVSSFQNKEKLKMGCEISLSCIESRFKEKKHIYIKLVVQCRKRHSAFFPQELQTRTVHNLVVRTSSTDTEISSFYPIQYLINQALTSVKICHLSHHIFFEKNVIRTVKPLENI